MRTVTVLRGFSGLVYLFVAAAGLGGVVLGILFFVVVKDLPRVPQPLKRIIETPPTVISDANNERILVLGGREFTTLNNISSNFIKAILSTEDHRFFDHHGVDKVRTLKALWITLMHPGKVQGASTITQQLAKNLFFSFEQSYTRKFRELLVALQIETQFSKQEILESYINQIPFGVGVYGIGAASHAFFGKPASELNLAEAALLAALPKSPTLYSPYRHPERAKMRQRVVLRRMVDTGAITREQADEAALAELELQPRHPGKRTGSYFLDWVLNTLEEKYGATVVYHGGLQVTTTLDPQLQRAAVASLQKGLGGLEEKLGSGKNKSDEEEMPLQGALVAVETKTGAVKAMVGGRDYFETEYNRAVSANRQPGSGFKPFLYYTAFEQLEMTPADVLEDKPITIAIKGAKDWKPRNFSRKHEGPMILKKGFMDSVNTIAAQLVEKTGPEAVIGTARRCGISSPLEKVYSVALGTSGVSPLEMASAYGTFATGGIRHEPFGIWRVEDAYGRVLEEHIVSSHRVLNAGTAYQVVDMMQGVVEQGTANVIRRLGFKLPAAGKTGTTNGYHDAWFTGFTPTLSTSVWVGFDKEKSLTFKNGAGITGGRGAAPIWTEFMLKATSGEPERRFPVPPNVRTVKVNPVTGRRAIFFTRNGVPVVVKSDQRRTKPKPAGELQ